MFFAPSWRILALAVTASRLTAGETLVVHGYARQATDGPILLSLSPLRGSVLAVPAAPGDRSFIPPQSVDWEVELTGISTTGVRTGNALRTVPSDFEWAAGEEIVAGRYHGGLGGMFPSADILDPLDLQPGSGVADYDQDGVPDEEDAFPGDPGEWTDTDGDGIGNEGDPDDDGDEMPDAWEIANGTRPLVADADVDDDGDGFTNGAEFVAGSLPLDASSFFHIGQVAQAGDSILVTFDAVPGRTYTLFRRPNFSVDPTVLRSGITSATAQVITVTVETHAPAEFYYLQVSIPAPP